MILATTEAVFGKTVKESLGLVQGEVVMSKHLGSDMVAGLKNIVGGEIKGYTDMMRQAREVATARMVAQAEELGADAVVGVRYGSSAVAAQASEMMAYGTAVKLK